MNTAQIVQTLQTHFDPNSSQLVNYDATASKRTLGETLTGQELIQLSGAPSGSYVAMHEIGETLLPPGIGDAHWKAEMVPAGLMLAVRNKTYINGENSIVLFNDRDAAGSISIYVKYIAFRKRDSLNQIPSGVGALMLRSMLAGIRNLVNFSRPFLRMRLMAAGGRNWGNIPGSNDRWSGYAVWPKYGFDSSIPTITSAVIPLFPHFPMALASCRKVSDVLALSRGGSEFWNIAGDGWYMDFDLAQGSPSERCLVAYVGGL